MRPKYVAKEVFILVFTVVFFCVQSDNQWHGIVWWIVHGDAGRDVQSHELQVSLWFPLDAAFFNHNSSSIQAFSVSCSYTLEIPPDGAWGGLKSDGTWTGVIGQLASRVSSAQGESGHKRAQERINHTWKAAQEFEFWFHFLGRLSMCTRQNVHGVFNLNNI